MTSWADWWDKLSLNERVVVLRSLDEDFQFGKQQEYDRTGVRVDWARSQAKWEWCHVDEDVRRAIRKLRGKP